MSDQPAHGVPAVKGLRPRTIRQDSIGKNILRLVQIDKGYVGLLLSGGKQKARVEGDDAEALWRELRTLAGKTSDAYFGFDGALTCFRRYFPHGFQAPDFDNSERQYKLAAKHRLDSEVPLEVALTGSGYGESVLSIFQATNLLSPYEKMRLKPLLRGSEADSFIQAAARFAKGETASALAVMQRLLAPHDNAKWTVVTYLSFLWSPEDHMFLKPTVTQDFAQRVGHPFAFDYQPALTPEVYSSLLDLVKVTRANIAELSPRDNIDLQSFIWVIGHYTDAGREPQITAQD